MIYVTFGHMLLLLILHWWKSMLSMTPSDSSSTSFTS